MLDLPTKLETEITIMRIWKLLNPESVMFNSKNTVINCQTHSYAQQNGYVFKNLDICTSNQVQDDFQSTTLSFKVF